MKYKSIVSIGVLAMFILSCSHQNESMKLERNKKIVRRYLEEIVNTGDTSRIREFIGEEYTEVYLGERYPIGIKGAIDHVLGVRAVYDELRIDTDQQFAEGDWVISMITVNGKHTGEWIGIAPTNKNVKISGVNVDKVIDGKIVEHKGAANILNPFLEIGAIKVVGLSDYD